MHYMTNSHSKKCWISCCFFPRCVITLRTLIGSIIYLIFSIKNRQLKTIYIFSRHTLGCSHRSSKKVTGQSYFFVHIKPAYWCIAVCFTLSKMFYMCAWLCNCMSKILNGDVTVLMCWVSLSTLNNEDWAEQVFQLNILYLCLREWMLKKGNGECQTGD